MNRANSSKRRSERARPSRVSSSMAATTPRRAASVSAATAWTPVSSATKWSLRSTSRLQAASASARKGGSQHRKLSDPRPIGDRAYTKQCVNKLSSYLRAAGFAGSGASARALSKPTQRDFEDVSRFLISRLDPSWRPERKFEDEFVDLFKMLHYPFAISRTALAAVGTSHTWPPLLAALTWLVDLIVQAENIKNMSSSSTSTAENDDDDDDGGGRFHEFASGAYGLFLSGDDEAVAQLRGRLEAAFEATRMDAAREAEAARAVRDEAMDRAARFREDACRLPELVDRRARLAEARAVLAARVHEARGGALKCERRAAIATCAAADTRRRAAEAARDAQAARAARLRVLGDADAAQRYAWERDAAQADLAATTAMVAVLDRRAAEASRTIREELDVTRTEIVGYDRAARALKLVPSTADNADGRDLSLCLDDFEDEDEAMNEGAKDDASAYSNQSSLDQLRRSIALVDNAAAVASKAREVVKPTLTELSESLRSRSLELRRKLLSARSEVERAELEKGEAAAEVASAKAELEAAEQRLDRDSHRHSRGFVHATEDAARLRDETAALSATLEERSDALEEKRSQLRAFEASSSAEITKSSNLLVRLRAELGCLADQALVVADAKRQQRKRLVPRLDEARAQLKRDSLFLDKSVKSRQPLKLLKGGEEDSPSSAVVVARKKNEQQSSSSSFSTPTKASGKKKATTLSLRHPNYLSP